MDRRTFSLWIAGGILGGSCRQLAAQTEGPVRLTVGFAPGGQADLVARLVAEGLAPVLGRSVIVENKPGGGGSIATSYVLSQPANADTVLFATSSLVLNYLTSSKPRYDPLKDFEYVTLLDKTSYVVGVSPSSPLKSLQDLVKMLKESPGKFAYGSAGAGTAQHLAGELFKKLAGVDIIHVPYKGSQRADIGLLSGEVQVVFENAPIALGLAAQNQMRILAICSDTRLKAAPDIPTAAEAGVPGLVAGTYHVLAVKMGTPRSAVETYYQAAQKVLLDDGFRKSIDRLVDEVIVGYSPEKTEQFIREDLNRWRSVVQDANVRRE